MLKVAGLAAALTLSLATSSPPMARRGTEPLTMPDMPLHDPWIVADAATRTYHLYTSNQRRMTGDAALGIMEYASRDLKHWTRPRVVFALPPGGWADAGAWAPEVHLWRGRWYLFATFHTDALALPAPGRRRAVRRATILASAASLDGPFALERGGAPIADPVRMTLDGTLYVAPDGRPWLVYAHEWVQVGDGTIEAVPLDDALASAGAAITLFRASDAPWAKRADLADPAQGNVTDGPELFRTRTGTLLMLWSSYDRDGYVQGLARSRSGTIAGPWEQLPPLIRGDSGHGMVFRRFDGGLMLVLHHPFRQARGRLYDLADAGDRLLVVGERLDLDGGIETHVETSP